MTEPDFNCGACKKKNDKEVRSNNKACDKTVSKPVLRHFTGAKFFTCPSNFYRESYAYWFDVLKMIQNGNMKIEMDWPNKNIEAINFLERLQANLKAEQMRANG